MISTDLSESINAATIMLKHMEIINLVEDEWEVAFLLDDGLLILSCTTNEDGERESGVKALAGEVCRLPGFRLGITEKQGG